MMVEIITINPNLTTGLVGGGRKGGWRKKAGAARPPGPRLEPATCRMLGKGPQLHAMGAV